MAKNPRSFRLSDPTVVDLQWLAERLRVTHTAAIERAVRELRESVEKTAGKARKKSEKTPE
jgi:predicted transcriptional regulator